MVFDSDTRKGRLVVLTKAVVAEGPMIVAIEPDGRIGQISAAVITSAYGKSPVSKILDWIGSGLLRSADKRAALAWLRGTSGKSVGESANKPGRLVTQAVTTRPGLQLPRLVQAISRARKITLAPNSLSRQTGQPGAPTDAQREAVWPAPFAAST